MRQHQAPDVFVQFVVLLGNDLALSFDCCLQVLCEAFAFSSRFQTSQLANSLSYLRHLQLFLLSITQSTIRSLFNQVNSAHKSQQMGTTPTCRTACILHTSPEKLQRNRLQQTLSIPMQISMQKDVECLLAIRHELHIEIM